ncbi:HalOD1 output domain-containing protein [Halosimplex marinum]|uniref:HalOD1 output domain-containing protein n=1 Tax=Halosimplex marinum TaxID=3396620 RepID=UPI003F57BDE7
MRDGSGVDSPAGGSADEPIVLRHDWTGRREPATAVVQAVAVAANSAVSELEPLGNAVDPDALDGLVDREGDGSPVKVSFEYEGTEVGVRSDGTITVCTVLDDA